MRQSSNGVFTTILMLVPVVVIPVIAMFGLPSLPENQAPDLGQALATNNPEAMLGNQSQFPGSTNSSSGSNTLSGFEQQLGTPSEFPQTPADNSGLFAGHSQNPAELGTNAQNFTAQPNSSQTPQAITPIQTPIANGTGASTANGFPANNQMLSGQPTAPPGSNAVGNLTPASAGQPAAVSPDSLEAEFAGSFPELQANNPFETTPSATAQTESQLPNLIQQPNPIQQVAGEQAAESPFGNPNSENQPNRFSQNFGEPAAQTPAASQAGSQLTWPQAVKRLNSYGITNFLLMPGSQPGTFHFSCFFVPDQNLKITHRFEAEDADPLKAFENVLQQIEQRRQAGLGR